MQRQSPFRLLRLAARMSWRDARGGELRLLAAAVVIAVAAVCSVGFFVDRVQEGLRRDAAQYLGGDAALESDRPIDEAWPRQAAAWGLRSTHTLGFPSMALADGAADVPVLVNVKAVAPGYPLRGTLLVDRGHGAEPAAGIPAPGTAWVEGELLRSLGLAPGQSIRLGRIALRVDALVLSEPDRRLQVLGFAPRVLLNEADLAASGLVQPASRVGYRWTVAGEPAAVARLVAWLGPQVGRGQHLQTLEEGQPDLQKNLERAQRFLGLVALVTVLIAAVAVGSAARRYARRRLDTCALLRCFGLAQGEIAQLFFWEFLFLGLAASALGVLAGLALHQVLLRELGGFLQGPTPWPSLEPAAQGLFCGLVLLLGFGLPPVEQLRRVAPLRVLRRDVGAPAAGALLAYGAGAAGFALLLFWTAGNARLGAIVGGGFLGGVALFAGAARVALLGLQALRGERGRHLPVAWRYAAAALQRRPGASTAQVVALAVGLMALLLLAMVRGDLVDQWRGQAPPQAPNRFVINVEPDQVEAISARLRAAGLERAALEPMVRGRLVAVDGRPIGPASFEDERARNLVEREFNLSYRAQAPEHNRIVQGHWFAAGADELSIEQGIAERLHIGLGQRLRFDVAGQAVEATVSSVRAVDWDSMRVNFFVIMAPPLLRDLPQTYITSFRLPPGGAALVPGLVRDFPNLTVIDTDQVLGQVRALLDQLVDAVQFLSAFALAAGVLVLYTALAASHEERLRESALLRALGAARRQLAGAQAAEMALVGLLAGLLAAAGAAAIAWAMAHYAFDFSFRVPAWLVPAALAAGIGAALLGGWAGLRRILQAPPLQSLRDA